jgi:hypothetical protein
MDCRDSAFIKSLLGLLFLSPNHYDRPLNLPLSHCKR